MNEFIMDYASQNSYSNASNKEKKLLYDKYLKILSVLKENEVSV